MGLFERIEQWKKENPKRAEDIERMLEIIQRSAAVTYQPLILPNLEIKVSDATPTFRM